MTELIWPGSQPHRAKNFGPVSGANFSGIPALSRARPFSLPAFSTTQARRGRESNAETLVEPRDRSPAPQLLLLLGIPASLRSQPAPGSLDGQAARIIRVALARPTNPTELARACILASRSGEPLPYAQEFAANPLQPIVTIAADPSDTDGHRVQRQGSRPCRSRLVPARK